MVAYSAVLFKGNQTYTADSPTETNMLLASGWTLKSVTQADGTTTTPPLPTYYGSVGITSANVTVDASLTAPKSNVSGNTLNITLPPAGTVFNDTSSSLDAYLANPSSKTNPSLFEMAVKKAVDNATATANKWAGESDANLQSVVKKYTDDKVASIPAGPPGPAGVSSVKASPLSAGSSPTADLANGVLTLGIPKGDKGDTGSASDASVANLVQTPSLTQTNLDTRYLANTDMPTREFGTGDQTTAVQAFVNDTSFKSKVRKVVGTFDFNGWVVIPAGIVLDLTDAVITQTKSGVHMFNAGANVTIRGGDLYGFGTDFVSYLAGSFPVVAKAIHISGENVVVDGTKMTGFANAGVFIQSTSGAVIRNIKVVGVNNYKGVTIPQQDAACVGIYLNNAPYTTITNVDVSECSIGIAQSVESVNLTMNGIKLSGIRGQHAVYLQNGTNCNVSNVKLTDISLAGLKVQLNSASPGDGKGLSISNVTAVNVRDTVILITQSMADVTGCAKHTGVTVSGVAAVDCFRVCYLLCVRGGSVTNVSGVNTTSNFITIIDCQDLLVDNISSRGSGRQGVLITNMTGSVSDRVKVSNVHLYNTSGLGEAGQNYGILVMGRTTGGDANNITLDGIDIYADNGQMIHGIYFAQGVQETFRLRNASVTGQKAGNAPYRLASSTRGLAEWSDIFTGGVAPQSFPSTLPVYTGSLGTAQMFVTGSATGPVSGVFTNGDRVYRQTLTAGQPEGWACVVTGGASSSTWAASTAYTQGTWVRLAAGQVFECTTAGTSGTTEPTVPTNKGDTVTDGTVVWTYRYQGSATFKALPNVAA